MGNRENLRSQKKEDRGQPSEVPEAVEAQVDEPAVDAFFTAGQLSRNNKVARRV